MWRFYFIGFSFLLLFDTCGQVCFKYTALYSAPLDFSLAWIARVLTSSWLYLTIISYSGAFATWMILLKHAPIGPAFAVSHMQIVTVMLVSVWLFNDHLTLNRVLGAALIIIGIIILAIAEKEIHKPVNQ